MMVRYVVRRIDSRLIVGGTTPRKRSHIGFAARAKHETRANRADPNLWYVGSIDDLCPPYIAGY